MGNTEVGQQSQYVTNIIVPQQLEQSQIKKILKLKSQTIQDATKKDFVTFKYQDFQLYCQIDLKSDLLQINGYGRLKKFSQIIFQGEFINSLRNGYGIQYQNSKIIYEGYLVNDLRDGWGKTQTYEGQFFRGCRQGWGVDKAKDGKYQGYWRQDKYQGMGIKSYSNISIQDLFKFVAESEIFTSLNKQIQFDIYIGEWKEGKRHGIGKLRKKNKQLYQGQFFNDLYNGSGTLLTQNKTLKGVWMDDKFIRSV